MTFNNGPGGHVDSAGTNPRHAFIQGAILHEVGHPNFNTAPVVNVEAIVRVPTAEVGPGTLRAEPYTPWTYVSSSTSGTDTLYRFTLNANGGTLATSASPTQVVFVIPRRSAGTTPVAYSVTFSGTSPTVAGAASSLTGIASI